MADIMHTMDDRVYATKIIQTTSGTGQTYFDRMIPISRWYIITAAVTSGKIYSYESGVLSFQYDDNGKMYVMPLYNPSNQFYVLDALTATVDVDNSSWRLYNGSNSIVLAVLIRLSNN